MDDIRMHVTESQIDKLAGRVAELERMLETLVTTLAAPGIAERIGLTKPQIAEIRRTFLTVRSAEMRHYTERAQAVEKAEKHRIFLRLRGEPGLAFPDQRRRLSEIEAGTTARGKVAAHADKPDVSPKARKSRTRGRP